MIVTLTLNPSLDRTIEIGDLVRGEVIRATGGQVEPGGKGVNVSRALLVNGIASTAVVPRGGSEGAQLIQLLQAERVDVLAVPIRGTTRSNITLAEPDGTVTKINEPGPELSADEFAEITARLLAAAGTGGIVVVCGSSTPGLPTGSFEELCRRVVAAGDRLVVDTSGPALGAAARAGATLVKPNREELAEIVARPLASLGDVVAAAEELRRWGAGAVLASLGADGAVWVGPGGVVSGDAPVEKPRSSVGAGDSLLAGFLAAGGVGPIHPEDSVGRSGTEPAAALAEALAWGAAAVCRPGSHPPGPADLRRDEVRIHTHPGPALAHPRPTR